jgi:hypothetical protein
MKLHNKKPAGKADNLKGMGATSKTRIEGCR